MELLFPTDDSKQNGIEHKYSRNTLEGHSFVRG